VPPEYLEDFQPAVMVKTWQSIPLEAKRDDWTSDKVLEEGLFIPAAVLRRSAGGRVSRSSESFRRVQNQGLWEPILGSEISKAKCVSGGLWSGRWESNPDPKFGKVSER